MAPVDGIEINAGSNGNAGVFQQPNAEAKAVVDAGSQQVGTIGPDVQGTVGRGDA